MIFFFGSLVKFSYTPRLPFLLALSAQRTPVVMKRSWQEFSFSTWQQYRCSLVGGNFFMGISVHMVTRPPLYTG